ncbi:MAG: hypothetical protein ABIS51_18605 [Sphingomonas sp.]
MGTAAGNKAFKLTRPHAIAARRILDAAARGISPIANVMAAPPTITQAASDGANSTIIAGSTIALGGGRFNAENPLHATLIGGPISAGRMQTVTFSGSSRKQGHSNGVAVQTYSTVIDFCLRANGGRVIFYVTDCATGVRARVQATTDIAATYSAANYYKLDFGGTPTLRIIEAYTFGSGNYFGINVPLTHSVWPAVINQPRLAAIWDSYGEGSMNNATNSLKLATLDYWAAGLGCNNVFANALGSTGVMADAAGTAVNYLGRLNNGDFDVSRVGNFDLILVGGTINDNNPANNGIASPAGDATFQAAYTAFIRAFMLKQPNAIFVGTGPELPSSGPPPQTRFDVTRAGFLAAAGGDPRMIYRDNSATGENWMFGNTASGINSIILGTGSGDNIHPLDVTGTQYLGERMARSTIAGIRAAYGL